MPHIILFLLQFIFLSVICALFFTIYKWRKTRNPHLPYFIFFLSVLVVKILLNYIQLYFKINLTFISSYQFVLFTLSEDISYLLIFIFPLVFHSILSVPYRRILDAILAGILLAAVILRCLPYIYRAVFPLEYFSINTFRLPEMLVFIVTLYIAAISIIFYGKLKYPILKKIALAGIFFYLFILADTYIILQALFMNGYYSKMVWPGIIAYIFWLAFFVIFSNIHIKSVSLFMDNIGDSFLNKYSLTAKEAEIVKWVITGKSNQEIADYNYLSIKTIKNHIYKIFQKTGVKNRLELTLLVGSEKNNP